MTDPPSKKMRTVLFNGIVVGQVASSDDQAEDIRRSDELIAQSGLRQKPDLALRMFGQAVAFSNVARRIYDIGLAKSPADGLAVAPFVTNSAFSIELYLKTLGQLFQRPLRGHKLLELFDALPGDAQTLIGQISTEYRARDGAPMDASFRDYLTGLNNAFVEWRYSYEHASIAQVHPFKVYVLCDVLHAACLKRQST